MSKQAVRRFNTSWREGGILPSSLQLGYQVKRLLVAINTAPQLNTA